MIAYAVGRETVCGRPMESGTKALVATPAGHSRIHTRCKRARQRIPGIRHFAQRKRRGVLLAIRKPLRRWSRVTLEIPSAPLIKNLKLPRTMRMLRSGVIRIAYADGWNLCGLQFVRPLA